MKQIQNLMNLSNIKSQDYKKDYKCDKCKDTLYIVIKDDKGITTAKKCECYNRVVNDEKLAITPLANKKDEYTFEKYRTTEEWQKNILQSAKAYVKEPNGWFYIGGQVGAGKTHICTAVVRNIAYLKNLSFEYILFNQKMTELKQWKFDDAKKEKYQDTINRLIEVDILFIDDLFKIQPTNADLDILFDIVNGRYLNNKICVISSEKFTTDIYNIDNAIGSRIIEKSSCVLEISYDESKNYRLKN